MITLKFLIWNVNSIIPRLDHCKKVLIKCRPDIILLQETRCLKKQFPRDFFKKLGYKYIVLNCEKARNGVALISKYPLKDINITLPGDPDCKQARYIEASLIIDNKEFKIVSVYVPHGKKINDEKFLYKLAFLDVLKKRLELLDPKNNFIIIGGDFNVDPDKKKQSLCCTVEERQKLKEICKLGYIDGFRKLNPTKKLITKQRKKCKNKDEKKKRLGLRLDHCFVSKALVFALVKVKPYIQSQKQTRKSRHTPLQCTLKWNNMQDVHLESNIGLTDTNNPSNVITKKLIKNKKVSLQKKTIKNTTKKPS